MKQFKIQCSKCGRWKRVRLDNFAETAYRWKSGGSTLICPECAKDCRVITGTMQTVVNMVAWLFDATEEEDIDHDDP